MFCECVCSFICMYTYKYMCVCPFRHSFFVITNGRHVLARCIMCSHVFVCRRKYALQITVSPAYSYASSDNYY